MKLTSKTVKKAWIIRKAAASELNCKVSLVSWKICLEMASEKASNVVMAKTEEVISYAKSLITVELVGSEKQIAYATDIIANALVGCINLASATIGKGKAIEIILDEKIVSAMNMNSDCNKIINAKSQYDWASKKSINSLVSVRKVA